MDKDAATGAVGEQAPEEPEKGYEKAAEVLRDPDKMERLLQKLEQKLRPVPVVGDKLADIPILVSMLKSWVEKEYTDVPRRSLIVLVGTLLYIVSPMDVIPDFIPIVGQLDDVAIVALCLKLIQPDLDKYVAWRRSTGREVAPE